MIFLHTRGMEFKDEEDFQWELSPEFWRMIEARRRETTTVSLKDFLAELDAAESSHSNADPSEATVTQPVNQA